MFCFRSIIFSNNQVLVGDFLGWVTLTKAPSGWVLTLLIPNTYFVEVVYKHSFLWTIWIIEPNSSTLYVHYTNLYTIKLALKISNKYLVSAVSSKKMIFKRIGIPKKKSQIAQRFQNHFIANQSAMIRKIETATWRYHF